MYCVWIADFRYIRKKILSRKSLTSTFFLTVKLGRAYVCDWIRDNPHIVHFCSKISFAVILALLCGEKFNQKLPLWRKNYKYQVCARTFSDNRWKYEFVLWFKSHHEFIYRMFCLIALDLFAKSLQEMKKTYFHIICNTNI